MIRLLLIMNMVISRIAVLGTGAARSAGAGAERVAAAFGGVEEFAEHALEFPFGAVASVAHVAGMSGKYWVWKG